MGRKGSLGIFAVALLWVGLSVWCWVKPADDVSASERRKLAQLPILNRQTWADGSFSSDFESYTLDQFPLRDGFRSMKAVFGRRFLLLKDTNGIYLQDGFATQIQYPLNESSVEHFSQRLEEIWRKYLRDSDCRIYLSLVPDKHYFLAAEGRYLALDYEALFAQLQQRLQWAEYIDLSGVLNVDDYYRTDTHWRQERLLPAADLICSRLGIPTASAQGLQTRALPVPFYGVYRGQAALPMPAETMYVLHNDVIDDCRVFNYETKAYTAIYDEAKLGSRDLYDIYLSGATALLRIDNPAADTDRELIVFRDSFGSSMIPLLVHGYKTVTVVDTRYISPEILGDFLEFDDQDVLFLYSTILINNSSAMK